MSVPPIRRDVAQMLAHANIEIADAEILLSAGPDLEKAHAAGRLAMLYRWREEFQRRLADIDQHRGRMRPYSIWQEAFSLSLGLERWIAG